MSYRKLTRLLYAFAALDDFVLIYPLYAVLFSSNGLSATAISSLYIAWSTTSFLAEVPAGAIADKYPRRAVLLAAVGIKALAFSAWLISPNYIGFLTGFLLWGISGSLKSGTEEALVYDELTKAGKTYDYTRVTGRMSSLRLGGIALAGFAASPLAHFGYGLILLLSVLTIVSSAVPIYLLPRAKKAESVADLRYVQHIREGFRLIGRDKRLLLIVLFLAVATGMTADEYYGLLFQEQAFSVVGIAFLSGVVTLFGIVGSLIAHRLERLRLPWGTLLASSAGSLFLAATGPRWLTPIMLGLIDVFTFAAATIFNARLQDGLHDTHRATATSVSGLLTELFALLTFVVFAVSGDAHSYAFSMQILAGIIAGFALLYGLARLRLTKIGSY